MMIKNLFRNLFWLFIFLMALLRLRAATQFGLSVDEAHYVLYAKQLDWSYFDHPPLVGWVQALFQLLPFDHLIQARLAPILISILTSKLIFNFLISKEVSEKYSLYAVMALNLTPMYNVMSVAFLPDTLSMPLTLLIILSTEKLLTHSKLKNWVLLGLWLGLAGLSKYTAVLYVFSLMLVFIYKNKLKELLKLNLWLGVTTSIALISPVLYWNIKNNWISFRYQADHVLSADSSVLKNLTESFVMQLLSWGLGPFFVALAVFFVLLKKIRPSDQRTDKYTVSLIFLTVFLLFFIYAATSEPLLPHWMLIYFVLMIPLAYSYLLQSQCFAKTLIIATTLSALLSLGLLFELGFKVFPAKITASLYEGVLGWDLIMANANNHLAEIKKSKKALAVMNWTLGSRALYYNNKKTETFVIDERFDQFDIWAPQSNIGYDLLVIIEADKKDEHLAHLNCDQLNTVGETKTLIKEVPVNHFLYYHCANFSGYKK